MGIVEILIAGVASWRLARMVTIESGPFQIFARVRAAMPLGGLLDCIKCASVWTACFCVLAIQVPALDWLVYIFAASGVGLLFAAYSGIEVLIPPYDE